MSGLKGKVAVITGGNSGIGLATARRFVEEGAYVFITGRRQAELDKAKLLIGKNVTAIQGDVTRLADLDRLYQTIAREKDKVDIIVANAGVVDIAPFETATPEHFDKVFNLNVRGTFFSVQKLLPLMKNGGAIVLVSSGISQMGVAGNSVYAATKAAMRSFARTWAAELKGRGIRVNTLSPGPIDTPMIDSLASAKGGEGMKAMYLSMIPLGRLGRPEEMASAALFLGSDESSFCTGIDLVADGGITQL